ncbi:hypothetical protein F5X68DRAFT_275526 [Plectosphaerella plurivora]|uniref:DUF7580 domain-containing protein n=1 Tax=Plectosphaerella plurivora TaxID=936078 RepID=A0A9P8VC20_9PEZI|nr:hypothetical protein F5X68DRAFT_275526 [Plectosphaerella plurivora]
MSGFEIAGVVLGAIPIVVEALSAYRAGKGVLASLRKSHGLVEDLIHRLEDQHWNFYLDILELLRNAEVPKILAEEDDPPPEKCIEILQAAQTGDEVKQYLGPLYDHFLEILKFHEKYLKEIASKLAHITRPPNAIRASKSPSATLVFKGKARFTIDRESLGTLVKDLGTERSSLERLIRRVKTKRDWEAREPASSSTALSMAFARVRESAISLYRAACQCWICDEHPLHTLMMRLEHRIPESKRHRATTSAPVAFRLCLSMDSNEMQRIEVVSRCAEDADARMNPVEQTLLALNVVSSMLQLRPTLWCSVPWNSSTIKFPVLGPTRGANTALRTPYVEQAIDPAVLGQQDSTFGDLTTEAARSTMLELAILLLEILHNRSIAAWAAGNDEGDTKTTLERMTVASHWLDMSTSKLLPPHFRAVEGCLLLCAQSRLLWDERFQRLYCENIIKPLQELADL